MMTIQENLQTSMFSVTLEEIVPNDHFLRKLDKLVDFGFVYDELAPYYCANNGRPSTDPVVIIKSLLIAFLYGIQSERRLEQELNFNVAYRWFLGLGFDQKVPDHSTVSQLRRRKFNEADLFKKLFRHVLVQCVKAGLVSGKLVMTDSTHVKAFAAKAASVEIEIESQSDDFFDMLDAYEATERAERNLPPIERTRPKSKNQKQKISTTDPDSGLLGRKNKPDGFHFLVHQTIDAKNAIILDATATAGNVHDSQPYLRQIDRIIEILDEFHIDIETAAGDSAYDSPHIHKQLFDRQVHACIVPQTLASNGKTEFVRKDFRYNKSGDFFTCPAGVLLSFRNFNRSETGVFREYRAHPSNCKGCKFRKKCLAPSQQSRKLQIHIFRELVDKNHRFSRSHRGKESLRLRQIWCEGTFALQKEQHNLRRLFRRGIKAAHDHCLLSATAINLKRMVKCLG